MLSDSAQLVLHKKLLQLIKSLLSRTFDVREILSMVLDNNENLEMVLYHAESQKHLMRNGFRVDADNTAVAMVLALLDGKPLAEPLGKMLALKENLTMEELAKMATEVQAAHDNLNS